MHERQYRGRALDEMPVVEDSGVVPAHAGCNRRLGSRTA
jgi:hypothetical protein